MKKFIFLSLSLSAILVKNLHAQNIPNRLLQQPNTPVVVVGGFINFNAAGRSQDGAYGDERLPDARLSGGEIDQTHAGTHNRFSKSNSFANDSEVYIKVGAISDSGLKYGAIIELEADTTTDGLQQGVNADKSFIFTESRIGKFEFGNNSAVNQKMKVGPSAFARATGGINGVYLQHINLPMLAHSTQVTDQGNITCNGTAGIKADGTSGVDVDPDLACTNVKLPRFILIPQSPIAHGGYAKGFYNRTTDNDYQVDSDGNISSSTGSFNRNTQADPLFGYKNGSFGQMEDATKVSYFTPRINGWQGGLSFTPDTGDNGTTSSISGADSGDIQNVFSWGINYSDNFGNLGVALSTTGEHGNFEKSNLTVDGQVLREDLNSADIGFMMTYFGFTIGGSYGYWGNSLQPTTGIYSCNYDPSVPLSQQTCLAADQQASGFGAASYYTAGLAYEFGPVAASLTYIKSDFQANEYNATSFGVDYKLARGLMPYFEITHFAFDSNQPQSSNIISQSGLSNDQRQLKDNAGYVGLVGILLSF